jgi:transposase
MPQKTPISEDIFQDALSTYHASKKPNIAAIARQFGISRHTLYGRIQGRRDRNSAAAPNRKLNPIQEKTLINWILSLNRAFIYPYPELIQDNANRLLKSDQELGHNWVYRFIKRLPPQFNYVTQKPKKKSGLKPRILPHLAFGSISLQTWSKNTTLCPMRSLIGMRLALLLAKARLERLFQLQKTLNLLPAA